MAAKTPVSVKKESLGSLSLKIADFTSTVNIDNGDTYASGMQGVVAAWFNVTSTPTVSGSSVAVSESSGTFTFTCDKDNLEGKLMVLTKSL